MSILEEIRALAPKKKDFRSFGWTVGTAFVLLWSVFWGFQYFLGKFGNYPVLWMIGAVLIVLGTVAPMLLKPAFYAWMSLAFALGFVMTRVLLTIFFFLVLTPVGLVFKLIGRDALTRKPDRQAATYWIEKEYPIADRSRYEKFF